MKKNKSDSRRKFIKTGAKTAALLSILQPAVVFSDDKNDAVEFKPHHYIALFRDLGDGSDPARYTSGNDYERAYNLVMGTHDLKIKLTLGVDFICKPCKHLIDGKCSITIKGHGPEQPLSGWAKKVDSRLFNELGLEEGATMTSGELAELCRVKLGYLDKVYIAEAEERTNKRALSMYIGLNRYLSQKSLKAGKLSK